MEINLSDIVKNDGSEKSFCDNVNIEPVKYMGLTVSFDGGVKVCGSVKNVGGALELCADVTGKLCTSCARCMKPARGGVLRKGAGNACCRRGCRSDGNDDVIVFSGYGLPLDEIVLNSIIVSMPVRYLCKEDCKGLCPTCGRDLNEGDCGCSSDVIDPRFEVLSKLCDK